jgi:hypothetical protein
VGVSSGAEGLSIQAQLWEYNSLCDFHDSENWPTKEIYKKGTSFTSTGCKDLETKYGHPPAILVKLQNIGSSELEIPLKGIKSINVVTKSTKLAPLAIRNRERSPFGSGYMKSFYTKFTGEKVIILQGSQVVDIIFIFSEAAAGDTLKIKDVGTAKINFSIEPSTNPLPTFKSSLIGNNEVRIKNRNSFKVKE